MKTTLLLLASLSSLIVLLFTACNKDGDMNKQKEIYNDGNHALYYEIKSGNIEFFIDVISDKNNELPGSWPDVDFYHIYVDRNSNGVLDSGLDLLFSRQADDEICMATLLGQVTTSACSYSPLVTGESFFSSTDNAASPHVNFTVSIPKNMLSTGSSANVVIRVHSATTGWQHFPSNDILFNSHYKIAW